MKGFFHHAGTRPAVRLLSLMLVATLLCGFGIFSAIGYEGDDSAVVPEQDASVVLDEADVPAEEVAEEPAEETVEEPAEDPAEPEETVAAAEESAEEVLPVEEDVAVPADAEAEDGSAAEEGTDIEAEPEEEAEPVAYPAQSFAGGANSVTVTVNAPEGALPEGTKMAVTTVTNPVTIMKINSAVGGDAESIRAVDISFSKDGVEIEPKKAIQVTLKSDVIEAADTTDVVHVTDSGVASVVPQQTNPVSDEVTFAAKDFSVYAVVGGSGDEARATVNFYNGDNLIAFMYVKNKDTEEQLKTILYDPGSGELAEDELFLGWTTDKNYNSSTARMDIDDVRAEMAAKEITEGDEVNYYAVIAKIVTLTFFDDAGVSIVKQDSKQLIGSDESVTFDATAAYTPSMATQNFEGWKVESGSENIISPEVPTGEDECYENGTSLVVKGSVELKAYAPEGRWLIFDENGKGGKYNAPQFVKTGNKTQEPCADEDMTRKGYSFGGWYTEAYGDEDEPDPSKEFTFGNELNEDTTIYAYWIPNETAPYTIVFWTQSQDRTHYDLKASYPGVDGTVGENIPYDSVDNGDEDYATIEGQPVNTYHYTGFCLKEDSKNQQVEITADGEAVLNLYYDRIVYNFKFYIYRDGTQNNRYDYANNSGNGSALNDVVTWHANQTAYPSVTGYTIQSETVGGRTYYYFVMSAYYEENISDKWPTYDKITGANGREAVSYVMMVGTKLKPNPTNQGDGTVKGIITVMNENILGATNNADGNYVVIRFPDSYYNWRYHIWYEAADGQDLTGKTTHDYNGKTYYEETVLTVRSSNTTDANQNEPKYQGFDYVTRLGQNASGTTWQGGHWTTTEGGTTLYHLNYIYDRQEFQITYMDGVYVDSDNPTVAMAEHTKEILGESAAIDFGAVIPADAQNYKPTKSNEDGFVFDGWYADAACSSPMTWTTMPEGGIVVYAKWVQKEYRVIMHPNAGTESTDPELSWGSDTVSMSFKVDYKGTVSTPTGTRPGYEFIGWYSDPDFQNVFLKNTAVTDSNTVEYAQTEPTELDQWGNSTQGNYNKDAAENRFWVTGKLELYAKWKKIAVGAPGITIVYDAGEGSNPPTDSNYYDDGTEAVAQGASKGYTKTETVDGEQVKTKYVFDHWVVQKWNGTDWEDTSVAPIPGAKFTVYLDDAKETDAENPASTITKVYTIQLRAEYVPQDDETPTHIDWYSNYGSENDGKGTLYRSDTEGKDGALKINEAVDILEAQTRSGYTFKGWTKTKGGTTADFLVWDGSQYTTASGTPTPVTQVAADEVEPYDDLYAVWEKLPSEVTVKVIGTEKTLP